MNETRFELKPKPDATFLIAEGQELSFAQVNQGVALACQAILRRAALTAGDRVALLMADPLPFTLGLLALMRLRVISMPLNSRLSAGELAEQLRRADCRLLICDAALRDLAAQLAVDVYELPPLDPGTAADEADYGQMNLDDDFAIIHTSGTSGKPKAALLTYGNIYHSARASAQKLGHKPDERWLCVLPLYHVGGLSIVLRSLIYGTTVEFGKTAPFDLQANNQALSEHPISLVSLAPTMLQRLLDARARPWNRQLRLILLGGEAPSPQLVQRCIALGLPIAISYGLTETASQVATALPAEVYQKPGSVGKALSHARIRVIDEHGEDCAPGRQGQLLVKGLSLMRGYCGDPNASERALRDGWLHTGDIGAFDEDGDLIVLMRRHDLIISAGENVMPAEVEAVLRSSPAIKEALVFARPDERWGQAVSALIVPQPPHKPTIAEIQAFARDHLAGYKLPRHIALVDALPRAASGKLQRRAASKAFDDAHHSQ